jgi:hypothetical protein
MAESAAMHDGTPALRIHATKAKHPKALKKQRRI